MRTSSQQIILQRRFEIEREVHIVTQYDDVEPKSVQEALTCPTKDEWRKNNIRGIGVDTKESSLGLG